MANTRFARLAVCLVVSIFISIFSTTIVSAQSSEDELHATIRTSVLSDPRSSGLPQTQIDALVEALANDAAKKGITAHDIQWKPQPVGSFSAVTPTSETSTSCEQSSFLCRLSEAFGFSGSDLTIPIWFGISSTVLILVLGSMIEMHRRKHAVTSSVKGAR